jgi:deoxyribodipyrimidine photolyase-related protein
MRNLIIILGDQLDPDSPAFVGFDHKRDAIWMAEVRDEASKVWSSKPRLAMFFSAMRHFADEQRKLRRTVHYREIGAGDSSKTLGDALQLCVERLRPQSLVCVEPGEYAVREQLRALARRLDLPLTEHPDSHFLATHEDFTAHAEGRKQLRMEFFYREMRRKHAVLMDGDEPCGGEWNFDAENRKAFGKAGPPRISGNAAFPPDATTLRVFADIEQHFKDHPGSLTDFAWPVTRADALLALSDFIKHRLEHFGATQDAMWTGEPFLFHARLSAALNLKLLNPREVIAAAEAAYRKRRAPLAAVEGFIRQILGWREYVRGIYWRFMPQYVERNALAANTPLPGFYWTGETDMQCLRESIGQTLRHGYAHHIQRLMVTGLFGLLLGVEPRKLHEWYLAVYIDAVEWVELPNTLGMAAYADGGVMASKPYVASGRYIDRMSNYCKSCRFEPTERIGDRACPFTTLYWDFLLQHETALRSNRRMDMQLKNLKNLSPAERKQIRAAAAALRERVATV